MSDKEILERAITKAIDDGWDFMDYSKAKDKRKAFERSYRIEEDGIYSKDYECLECLAPNYPIDSIIFNHDLAKSLWGEEIVYSDTRLAITMLPIWKRHLQQMVISDDPIKYLGENI